MARSGPPGLVGEGGVDPRVVEQLLGRLSHAVAVERVGVLVAHDHEPGPGLEAATLAVIVVDVAAPRGQHIVGPEADLVVVAGPVAVLGTIEHRRGGWLTRVWITLPPTSTGTSQWLLDDSRKTASSSAEYQSAGPGWPGRRAAALPACPSRGSAGRYGRGGGGSGSGSRRPCRTGPVGAEAEGVVRAADRAVVVQVEAGGDAGVGRGNEPVAVGDGPGPVVADRQVVLLEQPGGQALGVEVELVDEQHIRPDPLDDLGHRLGLDVVGVERSATSSPSTARFREALKVANRADRSPRVLPAALRRPWPPVDREQGEPGKQHDRRRPPPPRAGASWSHPWPPCRRPIGMVLLGDHDVGVDYGRTVQVR